MSNAICPSTCNARPAALLTVMGWYAPLDRLLNRWQSNLKELFVGWIKVLLYQSGWYKSVSCPKKGWKEMVLSNVIRFIVIHTRILTRRTKLLSFPVSACSSFAPFVNMQHEWQLIQKNFIVRIRLDHEYKTHTCSEVPSVIVTYHDRCNQLCLSFQKSCTIFGGC